MGAGTRGPGQGNQWGTKWDRGEKGRAKGINRRKARDSRFDRRGTKEESSAKGSEWRRGREGEREQQKGGTSVGPVGRGGTRAKARRAGTEEKATGLTGMGSEKKKGEGLREGPGG